MFRRREPLGVAARGRRLVWPQGGWIRAAQYVWQRMHRLSGSPHSVALGFAAGVFASCTPLIGFHILLAVFLAWVLGGNLLASALGTFIGNPFTYPLIWITTYELGGWLVGVENISGRPELSLNAMRLFFSDGPWEILAVMLAGSLPVGLALSAACYIPTRLAVGAYQARRRRRLGRRLETRADGSGGRS